MTLVDVIRVLFRRWPLVFLGLLLTAVVAANAGYHVNAEERTLKTRYPATYETSAVLTLTPVFVPGVAPPEPGTPTAAPDLGLVTRTVETVLGSAPFAERIHDAVPGWRSGKIDALAVQGSTTIKLLVSSSTRAGAGKGIDAVISELDGIVERALVENPSMLAAKANVVEGPSQPQTVASFKGPLATAIVGGLGLLFTWLIVVAVDGLRAREPKLSAVPASDPPRRISAEQHALLQPEGDGFVFAGPGRDHG